MRAPNGKVCVLLKNIAYVGLSGIAQWSTKPGSAGSGATRQESVPSRQESPPTIFFPQLKDYFNFVCHGSSHLSTHFIHRAIPHVPSTIKCDELQTSYIIDGSSLHTQNYSSMVFIESLYSLL